MTVTVNGLDAVVAKLEGLDKPEIFRRPMEQATERIRDGVAKYPPQSRKKMTFKTAKQRRYFFWALRTGRIEVPYRRGQSPGSEKLGTSWTVEISANGREGRVGNDTSYGPLVQDRHEQARYHRGTWQTAQDVVEREQAVVVGYFEAQYRRYTQG